MPIINQIVKGSGGGSSFMQVPLKTDSAGRGYPDLGIDLTGISQIGRFDPGTSTGVDFWQCLYKMLPDGATLTSGRPAFLNADSLSYIMGYQALYEMFKGTPVVSVDLPYLTNISGSGVMGGMFANCSQLTSAYLPRLTDGNESSRQNKCSQMFSNSGLQICDMRYVRYVGDYGILDNMFARTANLQTLNLNSLEHIGDCGARAFLWLPDTPSSSLQNIYFPMLTTFGSDPFYSNGFTGRENLTIHFRKDVQTTVETLANYATLWGAGTGTTVVFDLAGTLTGADGNSYARSEKDSVYASETAGAAKTATAWFYNDVTYYTTGGTEPAVSDTIYSDAACTTAVTTISAIA